MRSKRIRIQVAVLLFLLLPASAGVLAIHASAACERFVKTYVTRPIQNRVSKQTADAWAAWRTAHPNWKANPKNHRPKYVMTREESVKKVDFACAVETDPTSLDLQLEPETPQISMPVMTTELKLPPPAAPTLTELAELTPIATPLFAVPEVPVPGPVPEPGSLVLTLSGTVFLGMLLGMRALLPQI
jgi:hypothetical protein